MKRDYKITLWIFGCLTTLGLLLIAAFSWSLSTSSPSEIVTRELSDQELHRALGHLSSDIEVTAGFEASEYGGWHGDGGRVTIYLIDPNKAEGLLNGIKSFHQQKLKEDPDSYTYNYEWETLSRPKLRSLDHLIPEKFQPPADEYTVGRSRNRLHTVSIGKRSGYVCFGHVRM
jgi:hypothetical protein